MKSKVRVVFCGDLSSNNGPSNVNKKIQQNSNFVFINTKSKNKFKTVFLFIKTLLTCNVFIFSSIFRSNYVLFNISKIFHKKTIYLMHGCCQLDAKINKNKNFEKFIIMENNIIKSVNKVLVVSKTYMKIIKEIFPNYTNKISFLTSGIDKSDYTKILTNKKNRIINNNSIAVCGGNRIIKCNKNVVRVINTLNEKGKNYQLDIFGEILENNEEIKNEKNIKIHGNLPQQELFMKLSNIKLFVLNSQYESFGLSVVDALMCGCNILITRNAGINDILRLEETDMIFDINDLEEIERKIEYNTLNNNNERILKSIDFNYYSWKNVTKRLDEIANSIRG